MSTWQPYPGPYEPAKEPQSAPVEFEQPPWQQAPQTADPEPTSQELAGLDSRPAEAIDPDLDGDGKLDAAERAYAANRRNRRKWRKPVVNYHPSDGWEQARRHQRRHAARLWRLPVSTLVAAAVIAWLLFGGLNLPGWIWALVPITFVLLSGWHRSGRH